MPDDWTLSYEGYDPADERQREALCTLGNGYFATRGAAPETAAGLSHYPGTYVAGCYNRLTSTVAGRQVENEDIVNLPNWLPLRFRTRGTGGDRPGTWLSPDDGTLLAYRQTLDLRRGTLTRRMRLRDTQDRLLTVDQVRLVHMGDPHLAALRTEFTAEGWTGELEVESALDGDITNAGVDRYRDLNGRHLTEWHTGSAEPDTVWLGQRTVIRRPVTRSGVMRTHSSRSPPAHGAEWAAPTRCRAAAGSVTHSARPTTRTLQPSLSASSMWSTSKAASAPAARAGVAPRAVLKATAPSTTVWLTGTMAGPSGVDTETRKTPWVDSRAQHSPGSSSVSSGW